MVRHGWLLLIGGGLLSIPVGIDAFTSAPAVVIGISLALGLGPLLILIGFDALADRSGGGAARSGLQVAGLGLLILAGTRIASAVMPLTSDSRAGQQLAAAYAVATGLIALGSLVAGCILFRRWLAIALLLLVGAAALVATLVPNVPAMPAFTVWAVSCILLGLALRWTR